MEFRFGELFCGPGGLALGAMNASIESKGQRYTIRHQWATDVDRDSCETYRRNIAAGSRDSVICQDVRTLDWACLPQGEIDAFAFGFPCNDFSVVGEKRGINGVYGTLYSYGIRVLHEFRPQWFFAENVGGLRSANNGLAFQTILEAMKRAGYTITPHLYRFEEYGVPQARHRIIIAGIRSDIPDVQFRVPAPTTDTPRTCKEAIEEPPIPEEAPNHEPTKQSAHVVERLSHIKPGENAFTADLPQGLEIHSKGANISQIYKRLDPHKPSYTVTGSGGGGTHVYHWSENRALTNRERARLQTFPDDFVFCGGKESVRRQIGMALPPAGTQAVFEAILKSFAGEEYPSVEPNLAVRKSYRTEISKQLKLLERRHAYGKSV